MVALRVGTVDVPSGIDAGSLHVCVLDDAGACATDLSTAAVPHGVTVIPLPAPLAEPDIEVRAEVSDLQGNGSSLTRTVGFFLGQPSAPPVEHPVPDGGPVSGGPSDGKRLRVCHPMARRVRGAPCPSSARVSREAPFGATVAFAP